MNAIQGLSFLRPYSSAPLRTRRAVYLGFYDVARQHGAQPLRPTRSLSTTCDRLREPKKSSIEALDAAEALQPQNRSHVVAFRVKELADANALTYPRLKTSANFMRIPSFVKRYKNLKAEADVEKIRTIHGRLMSVRRASSKLAFLDIRGEFADVQGLCNFGKLEAAGVELDEFKKLFKLLKRGDSISITGRAVRTPTGELSIEATKLPKLLSPSLVPLPSKLVDEDTKIQNRHIDMLVTDQTRDILRIRSHVIHYLREFFHHRAFLEVQTPLLAENAGGAIARPFTTSATEFPDKELALRIAPELWLKRLVIGGMDRVFEIGPAFRNEGIDQTHNPEFTMCEFYQAYANLPILIHLTETLLSDLASRCKFYIDNQLQSLPPISDEFRAQFQGPYVQLEFIPSLESSLGFKLPDLTSDTAFEQLNALLEQHEVDLGAGSPPATTLPKLLDRLAAAFIEPHSAARPIFITHHPVCMSPLAKSFTCPRTGQIVSARAELFVAGRELANMYEEENDPFAQRRKLADQLGEGAARNMRDASAAPGEDVALDDSFVEALESGLPPTGGWGCGVERLVMLFSGARRISDCLAFGNLRNVVGLTSGRARKEKEDEAVPPPGEKTVA